MTFISTRNISSTTSSAPLGLSDAILRGLAPDGGLYVPANFPKIEFGNFNSEKDAWADFAAKVLQPFFAGDALENHLREICKEAFDFPLPLQKLPSGVHILELFHGPTCAFKDVGAQFLAACMQRIPLPTSSPPRLVLVATSGDTGGAVAAAFSRKTNIPVVILYPDGKISPLQEQQLTCWGDAVTALAVQGDFDDCQRLVKEAFQNAELRARFSLISANSISLGRLLPQMVYFAGVATQLQGCDFIVPTGNLGNAMAAYWARAAGAPIGRIHFALNANSTIADFIKTGEWVAHPTRTTLANAMDVGNPSNAERLRNLFSDLQDLPPQTRAITASDQDILLAMQITFAQDQYVICPHTATAMHAHKSINGAKTVVVATAHPAKFFEILPSEIAQHIKMPAQLAAIVDLPSRKRVIANEFTDFLRFLPT